MERFAVEIDVYVQKMKMSCARLKSSVDAARPHMADDVSRKAFQKIEAFADNLVTSLPGAEIAAEKLRESAKYLRQALSIDM
jgi:hypothetical protein